MPNWKAPGKDGFQGYWIKNLSNLHERIAIQMNKIVMGEDSPPAWMTYGRTVLCQKDPRKGKTAEMPITDVETFNGNDSWEAYNYLERDKQGKPWNEVKWRGPGKRLTHNFLKTSNCI